MTRRQRGTESASPDREAPPWAQRAVPSGTRPVRHYAIFLGCPNPPQQLPYLPPNPLRRHSCPDKAQLYAKSPPFPPRPVTGRLLLRPPGQTLNGPRYPVKSRNSAKLSTQGALPHSRGL